ncbi:MAG: tRNA epoxyqueuosine(34) reductase QueG [Bdellovibrio sp.]|nr:tRNA epoxyqueuosine(34) reductase QueG [Bdellovibrio sp.]
MTELTQTLLKLKDQLGFNQLQIGPLGTPITISFYEKWIGENLHAGMGYLKDHMATKKDPRTLNQNLNSVITVTQSYFPTKHPLENPVPARIATYAQNNDYHFWLKEKLNVIIDELKIQYPDHEFMAFVDSGPILERNWAYENGMGWFGKNTCLIHPQFGSLFFIAEILTTLPIPPEELSTKLEPLPDFCGKCRKCIDICPTNALIEPHVMKAELCISYLTIESKTNPPIALREKMGDWFFGCDLCQTTCPWNEKVFRKLAITESAATSTAKLLNLNDKNDMELTEFFRNILTSSNKQLAKQFFGTPLFRAGGNLKRNALIVIANKRMVSLKPQVKNYLDHPKFSELAEWCLAQLDQTKDPS